MKKVKIYLSNQHKNSRDIVHEGLSGKSISSDLQFVDNESNADVVLDCQDLHTLEQFKQVQTKVFARIWEKYKRKNAVIQRNQKKLRKK